MQLSSSRKSYREGANSIDQKQFEDACLEVVIKAIGCIDEALKLSNLTQETSIDAFYIGGGHSGLPIVSSLINKRFGLVPKKISISESLNKT